MPKTQPTDEPGGPQTPTTPTTPPTPTTASASAKPEGEAVIEIEVEDEETGRS